MLSILLTYLLLLLVIFLFQRKMIYFPDKCSIEQQRMRAGQLNLRLWPSDTDYLGLISDSPQTIAGKGSIIAFHGNAGAAIDRLYYIQALERQGYRVILAEYPGYGARDGSPSEATLIANGIETAQQVLSDFGGPLFLWGESLGSGVVTGIVQSGLIPVKGIVLITPFDSLANVAQHHYWFFLAKWLTRDRFNNVGNLLHYMGPTAIVLAESDEIIPNKFSLKLYDSLRQRKKLWTFAQANHNRLPLNPNLPWWQEVMQFVAEQNGESR